MTRFGTTGQYIFGGPVWSGKGLQTRGSGNKAYVRSSTERGRDGKKIKRDLITFSNPKEGGSDIPQEDVSAVGPASAGRGMVGERELFGRNITNGKKPKFVKKRNKDGTYVWARS